MLLQETLNDSKERLIKIQEDIVEKGTKLRVEVEIRQELAVGRLRDRSLHRLYSIGKTAAKTASDVTGKVTLFSTTSKSLHDAAVACADATEALAKPLIDDYDALNVKTIVAALETLTTYEVEKVRAYEAANKNRITILRAAEKRLHA